MDFARVRACTTCPMCLKPKERGLVVHWGRCYRESGFKDGTPEATAIVDRFDEYLAAVERAAAAIPEFA